MQVDIVETRNQAGDPGGEDATKLIMVLDGKTEVVVYGYGSGEYQLHVRAIKLGDQDPAVSIAEAAESAGLDPHSAEFWGTSLVWARPLTIAHVVADFLYSY